ncbi:transposase [Rhodococcus ruber]|uniref:transposase n=1 Tax=Rhodococcus ruber TaxID=1830 RepID=UPI001EEECCE2|nr:transposase [Rhodococcus ruber]
MADAAGQIVWDVSVDSTVVRAHQHADGARRSLQLEPPGGLETEPDDHALGRSRGGWSTKMHLGCEQNRRLLAVLLTPGQHGDSPQFSAVLKRIRVPRLGSGRARTRLVRLLADNAYSSRANRANRAYLRRHGIRATLAIPSDQLAHRRRRGSRGAGPRHSTVRCIGSGTRSSAASTSTGRWPPALTSSPCVIWPPSMSPPSTSGYESADI